MPKVNRAGGALTPRSAAPEGLSAADKASILKMIAAELKKTGDDFTSGKSRNLIAPKYMVRPPKDDGLPIAAKYMVRPPKDDGLPIAAKYMVRPPKDDGSPIAAKYMVRPPKDDGLPIAAKYMVVPPKPGGGPIAAKYMVVPPGVVPMYMVVPPWAGLDAHQAVINRVSADGKVTKSEALLLRKLFNRDIAEAKKEGKDIRPKVVAYLHKVMDKLKVDSAAEALIFGPGGPGFTKPPVVAKYMVVRPNAN